MNTPTLQAGYAETSTRKNPVNPDTVIVGQAEQAAVRFVGISQRDGYWWNVWKVRGVNRYYFQLRLGA